jgi:hypothetical protein
MRRRGWSCQVPVRQALERDEETAAVWKAEVWPEIKGWRDLGAFICFEVEAGQRLRPPKRRTWAPRGAGRGRISIAGWGHCFWPGDRLHLSCRPRARRRRKGEPMGFTWADYRDLIVTRPPPPGCAGGLGL